MSVKHLLQYLLIWLLLSNSLNLANAEQISIQGTVQRVMDGDTVQLLTEDSSKVKIRLLGIDAPESQQLFGPESKQHLIGLSESKSVTAECIGVDRYKRLLCKLIGNDVDLNLEQIKSGMAWHYKEYAYSQSRKDQEVYASAETQAQHARVGLWTSGLAVPPWEYRKGTKTGKGATETLKNSGLVKMSGSRICHEPGGRYYGKTTSFTPFQSMAQCIEAGGRLPKK